MLSMERILNCERKTQENYDKIQLFRGDIENAYRFATTT